VKLVMRYTVSSISDGSQVDAVEYRRISYGGEQLGELVDQCQLKTGTYETFRLITLPEQALGGDYLLEGVIRVGDKELKKGNSFRLQ
jgi:hypothetical protein